MSWVCYSIIMGFFGPDGYLKIKIDISSQTIDIIDSVILFTSFLIQCAICMPAVIKMSQNSKSNMRLEACFLVTSICACSFTVTNAMFFVIDEEKYGIEFILWFILYISGQSFLLSLLCTFILKLYITFKPSCFRMPLTMIRLFAGIVAICALSGYLWSVLLCFCKTHSAALLFCFAFVYVMGCVLAVYFFAINLLKLAKLQGQAMSSRNLNVLQHDIKLSPRQQNYVDLATKSMMLFAIQIGSTIFNIFIFSLAFPRWLSPLFTTLDVNVNLLCSYYQFGFAQKHYRKCCGFCDNKFQGIMMNWIKGRIFSHSLSRNQAILFMNNVHSTSKDTKQSPTV